MALNLEDCHEFEVLGSKFTIDRRYSPIKVGGRSRTAAG